MDEMKNNGTCYELTLTPNYVSDWTFNDAIRELIQNGTDQEILERDRKTCDSWNIGEITSLMIAEAMVKGGIPIETVRRMVEERADDVYHFEFNTYQNDVKKVQEMLLESFDNQNPQPYSIPVDSQEDIKKVKAYGGNPVVVPAGVAKLLKDEKDKRIKELMEIPCANVMTLKDRFNRWYDIYSAKLTEEAKAEIRNLIDEME